MTTQIKTVIDQLSHNETSLTEITELIDTIEKKSSNVVVRTLLPAITERLCTVLNGLATHKIVLEEFDKYNDVDPTKFTYDVMYPDGRIEIGLHAPSKEKLLSILTTCEQNLNIQILRVIDSNGRIIESNTPHYTNNSSSYDCMDENTKDNEKRFSDLITKQLNWDWEHDTFNSIKNDLSDIIESKNSITEQEIEQKILDSVDTKHTCFGDIHTDDEMKTEIETFAVKDLPKIIDEIKQGRKAIVGDKVITTERKPTKKTKKTKKSKKV